MARLDWAWSRLSWVRDYVLVTLRGLRLFGMRAPKSASARVLSRLIRYVWALPNTLIGLLFVPTAMLPRGRMQVIDGVLEAHGPLISAILRHCVPIPSGASAITFGHVVLGRDRWSLDATRAHERVHVRQYEIWGPAFIPAYLIAGLWGLMSGTGAYTGNYFERQANDPADPPEP